MSSQPTAVQDLSIWLPLLFVVFWAAILSFISFMSGWRALAFHYRCAARLPEKRWRFRSAAMRRWTHYTGCLTFGTDESGLYIAVFPLFRFAHPSLFVPWAEVFETKRNQLFFRVSELTFTQAPDASMFVWSSLAAQLLAKRPLLPRNPVPVFAPR